MKVKKVKVRKNLCLEGREVFAHKTSIQGGGNGALHSPPTTIYCPVEEGLERGGIELSEK